jgi:signal transduction histidine kinase
MLNFLKKSPRLLVIGISATMFLVLAMFNVGSWFFLKQMERHLDAELAQRLTSVAHLSARLLESNDIPELYVRGDELSIKVLAEPLLNKVQSEVGVQNVFLVDRGRRALASAGQLFAIGQEIFYLRDDSLLVARAWRGEVVASPVHTLQGNRFKTAYAPVRNALREVSMVVVIEANAAFFEIIDFFLRTLIIGGIISFAVLIIFGVMLLLAMGWFLRAEASLRRAERLASMGQMAAIVAHEIRNPLGIIKSTADVLKSRYDKTDQPDELFEFIPSEVRRLNRLVSDFLSFSRDRELKLAKDDLTQTVQKALVMVQREHPTNAETIQFYGEITNLIISHDADAMIQVLLNLLMNSLDATEGRGAIRVLLASTVERGNDVALLEVADNGPGLPASAEKVFEPFFTTKTRGSGLGLAVCKQIVERHGGKIVAESEKGKGTVMRIYLPMA